MIKSIQILLLLLFVVLFWGCAEQKSENSKDVKSTKLAEILKQPADYFEKEVVISGNYFTGCSSSCCDNEFILKDGIDQIKVLKSKEVKLPEMKIAQPILVAGILKSTAESPYVQASSVEVRK